jgi:hypothetical protein
MLEWGKEAFYQRMTLNAQGVMAGFSAVASVNTAFCAKLAYHIRRFT